MDQVPILDGSNATARRRVLALGAGVALLYAAGQVLVLFGWPGRPVANVYVALALTVGLAVAGGYYGAGAFASCTGVFLAVLAGFVTGPAVGVLLGSHSPKYAAPQLSTVGHLRIDPWQELVQGFGTGALVGLTLALVLGVPAFLLGVGCRWLAGRLGPRVERAARW